MDDRPQASGWSGADASAIVDQQAAVDMVPWILPVVPGGAAGVAAAAAVEDDHFSWQDSERFEEDSLCSWISEPESLCHHFRGWSARTGLAPATATTNAAHASGGTGALSDQQQQQQPPRYTGGISTNGGWQPSRRNHGGVILKPAVGPRTLEEMAARAAARNLSFDDLLSSYQTVVSTRRKATNDDGDEHLFANNATVYTSIPDKYFLPIVHWCFPESEDDIRLYSCLANGNAEEFARGDSLFSKGAVSDVFQIGYHISAIVLSISTASMPGGGRGQKINYNVAIRVDRCRIVSCDCSCPSEASWCCHVVAVCLHRIYKRHHVEYRMIIWDSINELDIDQLKKFAQNFINELPRQYLPAAQRLLDQLKNPSSSINRAVGAPDPTDGGHEDVASWCLDDQILHENIRKILVKFGTPSQTTVLSDVNYLSNSQPLVATEWQMLLRPLRGKEPEGVWNLFSIVRELYRRHDQNATTLLDIITRECLHNDQVLIYWYQTKLFHSGNWMLSTSSASSKNTMNGNQLNAQYSCASLCDEMVLLWRMAALNPRLTNDERRRLIVHLQTFHRRTVERVWKILQQFDHSSTTTTTNAGGGGVNGVASNNHHQHHHHHQAPQQQTQSSTALIGTIVGPFGVLSPDTARFRLDWFPGFAPALEACLMDWSDVAMVDLDILQTIATQSRPPAAAFNQALSINCAISPRNRTTPAGMSPNIPILRDLSTPPPPVGAATGATSENRERRKRDDQAIANWCAAAASVEMIASGGDELLDDDDVGDIEQQQHHGSISPESGQESDEQMESPDATTAAGSASANPNYFLANYGKSATTRKCQTIPPPAMVKYDPFAELTTIFDTIQPPPAHSFDRKFARCEALHVHGYTKLACQMAVELAEELMRSPPNLLLLVAPSPPSPTVTTPPTTTAAIASPIPTVNLSSSRRKKKATTSGSSTIIDVPPIVDQRSIDISLLSSLTLSRAIFLFEVLLRDTRHHRLAFALGLCMLELPRQPSATKPLEVTLNHQDSEIVALLKRVDIGVDELQMIRRCAQKFTDGDYSSYIVVPIALAHFIFDCLSNQHPTPQSPIGVVVVSPRRSSTPSRRRVLPGTSSTMATITPADDELGFEAALEALGMKLMVSESEHPLLCEGTRRQRGELALALLLRYKDVTEKLAKIMDKLLDPNMHRMFRHSTSNAAFYGNLIYRSSTTASGNIAIQQQQQQQSTANIANSTLTLSNLSTTVLSSSTTTVLTNSNSNARPTVASSSSSASLQRSLSGISSSSTLEDHYGCDYDSQLADDFEVAQLSALMDDVGVTTTTDEDRSGDCQPSNSGDDVAAVAARRLSSRYRSTDEGNSSSRDESPRLSDTSSSGISRGRTAVPPLAAGLLTSVPIAPPALSISPITTANVSLMRPSTVGNSCDQHQQPPIGCALSTPSTAASNNLYRINRRKQTVPCIPNQASEAHAHYMTELAKRLLTEAGGNHSTVIFQVTQNGLQNNPGHANGPHRQLHLCAFQIFLYALGLHNRVSPNWLSRTYSTHVSWISGQAVEIGRPAIRILIDTWENHLTPTEIATLADKASQNRETGMAQAAAELALSVLPKANALTPAEIQRALNQCRDQSTQMLERACLAVEQAAEKDGVYPEVLFKVARVWYELYEEPELTGTSHSQPQPQHVQHQQQYAPPSMQQLQQYLGAVACAPPPPPPMCQQQELTPPTTGIINVTQPPPSFTHRNNYQSQQPPPPLAYHSNYPPHPIMYSLPPIYPHLSTTPVYRGANMFPQQSQQQPVILPYGFRPPQMSSQYRQLHASHSAPNLNPIPHMSRRHHHQQQQQQTPQQHMLIEMHQQQQQPQQNIATICGMQQGSGPPLMPDVRLQSQQPPPPDPRIRCLVFAHRVGMRAMETMGTRNHDENRSYTKYSQNPNYGDDVRWLFTVSQKLGLLYAQHFCEVAARSVVSPFILYYLAMESVKLFPPTNPTPFNYHNAPMMQMVCPPLAHNGQSSGAAKLYPGGPPQVMSQLTQNGWAHPTAELMQRCLEMFYAAANQKLSHPRFMASDTEEVIALVKAAKCSFHMIPVIGSQLFDDFMRHVRKQKACKKDVAHKINAAAQCDITRPTLI